MKHVPRTWHSFPVGRSPFRKSIALYKLPLSTTLCLASLPLENWHVMLCVGTTPPRQVAATLSLPEQHNEHQIHVPKAGTTEPCFYAQNERSQACCSKTWVHLGENQAMKEPKKQGKENLHNSHRQNAVSNGPKSKTKCPIGHELANCPIL